MDKIDNKLLDKIDRKLLRLLQENARYTLKQLSEKVFLSSPAVAARIEKLEKEGIISGYHVNVDPEKLGYHITAFINLEMPPDQKAVFLPYIATVPNVVECDVVSGNYTVLMKVIFPSTSDLNKFIDELQLYGHTETQIVFSSPVPYRGIVIGEASLR
jgi:Lrp/AsnC family leucine-responsive transcriptional regulator